MAISPKEAALLREEEIIIIDQVEQVIDQQLYEKYTGDKYFNTLCIDISFNLSNRIKTFIKKRYQSYGWEVIDICVSQEKVTLKLRASKDCELYIDDSYVFEQKSENKSGLLKSRMKNLLSNEGG